MVRSTAYYKAIQNAKGTTSKKELDLNKVNSQLDKHFEDTIDFETVLNNNISQELIIEMTKNGYIKNTKARHDENINVGDMIDWINGKWLVTSIDPDIKTYKRATLTLCTILLRWQNIKGEILERWCVDKNASSGIEENKVITTSNSKFDIQLTLDDETKILKIDKRFLIDVVGVDVPDAYKITDRNVMSDNFTYCNRGGVLNLTIENDQFNSTTDNKTLMIANYFPPTLPPDNPPILSYAKITSSNPDNTVTLGSSSYRTLTATFYNATGVMVTDIIPVWTIETNGMNIGDFVTEKVGNICRIKVNLVNENYDVVGNTFTVNVMSSNGGFGGSLVMTIMM